MAEYPMGLDAILETCLQAIETQGWTVNDCLDHFASYRSDLEPLLRTAGQYRSASHMSPSPAFQEQALLRLRTRLNQSARPGLKSSARRSIPSRPRASLWPAFAQRQLAFGFVALIVIMGFAAITTGTIYAAGDALPGDLLYPVEQTVEQVQLTFAPPGQALGLRMDIAEKRLKEAEKLRKKGDDGHMQEALDGYNQLADDVTQKIDSDDVKDQALLDKLSTRLALQQARLEALLSTAPPAAQAGITTAIEASRRGQEKAAQAIKDHGGGKPEDTPGGGKPGDTTGGSVPDVTTAPGSEDGTPPADTGKGTADCSNGVSLPGSVSGQAHKLANQYDVPYSTVHDLFCAGLTAEQVEAQISQAAPEKTPGNNGKGNGGGNGKGKP